MSSIIPCVEEDPSSDTTGSAPATTVNHPVSVTLKYRHNNSIKVLRYKRRRWLKFPWQEPNEARHHTLRPEVVHYKSISLKKQKTHTSEPIVDALPALKTHPAYLTHNEKREVSDNDENEPEEIMETREVSKPMHVSYSCFVEFDLCYRLKHAC